MASSPLRVPAAAAAAAAGQQQSRLLDMQKKFQQRHLATLAAVKGASNPAATPCTTSPAATTNAVGRDPPTPPIRRFGGGAGVGAQQQQRRTPGAGSGGGRAGSVTATDGAGDSVVQVDVKGKQQPRPTGRINSRTANVTKKPLATENVNGRGAKKPADPVAVTPNRLLLPPVVQSTATNAVRPIAPGTPRTPQQKPAAPARQRAAVVKAAGPPVVKAAGPPVAQRREPSSVLPRPAAVKQQLSADRGPPAKGMARCPLCARDFAADRLPKHEEVCRRTREKDRKRKVFDVSRKRLENVAADAGVDVASLKKKSQKEDQRVAEKLQKKKDAWRKKHDSLVRNVRAARAVQRHLAAGGTIRDLPPELENAGSADQDDEADSDLVKCPHCNRTFNEASAERHVPLCADRQRNAAARMQNKKR